MLPQRLTLLQTQQQWAAELNPLLQTPIVNGQLLTGIQLQIGLNIISHGLGRDLVGWFQAGLSGPATIYDNQLTNPSPQRTLQLTSNAKVLINLWVF